MTEDRADHDSSTPEAPRAPTEPRLPNEPAAAATLDSGEDALGADQTVGRAESLRAYLPSFSLPSFGVRRRRRLRSPATRLQVPVWELGLLVVILLLGAYFRFVGLNWDNGQHLHP